VELLIALIIAGIGIVADCEAGTIVGVFDS
jgi:hypothetical protein